MQIIETKPPNTFEEHISISFPYLLFIHFRCFRPGCVTSGDVRASESLAVLTEVSTRGMFAIVSWVLEGFLGAD